MAELEVTGEFPTGEVLFASCDSKYFNDFGIPLAYSCNEVKNNLHLHVMNPNEDDYGTATVLKNDLDIQLTVSYEEGGPKTREYYSCNRFIIAPHMIANGVDKLMIIDTDCLVMNKYEWSDADLGLYLRDPLPGTVGWEKEGTNVAAGIVLYTKKSLPFAQEVAHALSTNELIWFIDQVALWSCYKKHQMNPNEDPAYKFEEFTSKEMDWEFIEGSTIWTGKGPRKYDNETYVAKQQYFRDQFNSAGERYWA